MKSHKDLSMKRYGIIFFSILICISFIGCATATRIIPLDKRIPLSEQGDSSASFQSGPLKLEYSYNVAGDNITISGKATHKGGFDSLDIYILFLDDSGKILSRNNIYSSGFRNAVSWRSGLNFSKEANIPQGATGISFSYNSQPYNGR